MFPKNPQFLYMLLVLPSLFGITLLGEGLNKLIHAEWAGIISILFGLTFIGIVIFVYMFFSSYLAHKV